MIFYLAIVSVIFVLYVFQRLQSNERIPPGLKKIPIEKRLPLIGFVRDIEKPFCNYLYKLSQKHGPIYQIRFGMRDVVVLNSFEYIKAALVDNGEALSGRWKALKYIFVTYNTGLIFIDGDTWSKQRSFVLKTLKGFGMGRSRSMEIVHDECVCMLDSLKSLEGQKVDFASFISIYTTNVISKLMMSKRFILGDPEFEKVEKCLRITFHDTDLVTNVLLMFPFLENIDWLTRFLILITFRKSLFTEYYSVFENEIEKHSSKIDFSCEGEDLVDKFLIIQHKLKEASGNIDTFTDFQLVKSLAELLAAGYDTTSSTLVWGFMFMSMFPEIQDKVYKEISEEIGTERLPTMGDKKSLNYSQAVMDETLRFSTVGPLAIFHRTLYDVNLKGYFIPKDTVVVPNLFACHIDPDVWEKPFEFNPEHFLTESANGTMKYKSRDELIPFSTGKRQCLGESLARIEYFIFFTSVLQRYQVSLADKNDCQTKLDVFLSNDGFIRTTNLKDFIFNRREDQKDIR